ncbi:MAG: BlaI/MecI/CopY family transcriptional regulator [Planctomycetota bacterium]|nr:BlaI/MecI/CopY family transcriptional regulator [Planctomycetota bacterium]
MARKRETLGKLELETLQFVADHPASSVREVADHFANISGQARTTLLTVMERLRAKGYLSRRKVEGIHRYRATISKAELLRSLVGDFVDDVLGGSVSPFVAYLSQSSDLTGEEVQKLEELLARIEQQSGDRS